MNVPEGVNTEAENLLSRIPIPDLIFCDNFFMILLFRKSEVLENMGISNSFTPIYIY